MSVTAPEGFEAAGVACGVKASGDPDLALVATADRSPVTAAGVFTTNQVQAAPVQVSRRHLADARAAAVVLNSGNANAATGEPGLRDAEAMCRVTAERLSCPTGDVLVCSTGLIGIPLPMAAIEAGIPRLADDLGDDAAAAARAAQAILTTDTVAKEAARTIEMPDDGGRTTITVGALAKGAAMLSPAMATMLAVATTDAAIDEQALSAALDYAVDSSFHRITVDGCTSTNDTVLVLANGRAGNPPVERATPAFHAFTDALTGVLRDLAEAMVRDAEGATKFVRVNVRGAASDEAALRLARQVAGSTLVKCSLAGSDPYWGRVLSELGAAGVAIEPGHVSISYNGVVVCREGTAAEHDPAEAMAAVAGPEIDLTCDIGVGTGQATILTSDLTHAYLDENMGTS